MSVLIYNLASNIQRCGVIVKRMRCIAVHISWKLIQDQYECQRISDVVAPVCQVSTYRKIR
jgi:hypothetical protein